MFRIFNVSIFKSAESVPKNLFSFHVPSDLFTSEDSRRVGKEFVDWQQATLTLDLSNSCIGDPLTALNKGH